MRVVHVLRKYNPAEWGGTETAIQRLFEGLRQHHVTTVAYCPRITNNFGADPLVEAGFTVKRFRAFMPVWGISRERHRQLVEACHLLAGNEADRAVRHTARRMV